MVRDPMDLHNAFLASFENVLRIDNAVVPVRFFNPQPKLKPVPVYPEIVIQVQLPTPGKRVWLGTKNTVQNLTDVSIQREPEQFLFPYQVSSYADRFDHVSKLLMLVRGVFAETYGQPYLTVDGDKYDVVLNGTADLPQIDSGVFEYAFTYTVFVPVFMVLPVVAKRIVTPIDQAITVHEM